jgi:hypothetical protein
VIVHNLHIVGVPVVPDETNAVLIVHPNAVLSASVACERLDSVAGESRQIAELASRVELLELSLANPGHLLQPPAEPAREERLGFGVLERPNHVEVRL